MTTSPSSVRPLPKRAVIIGLLIATAVIGAYAGAGLWLSSSALLLAVGLMWRQSSEANRLWYAATIGLRLPQSLLVSRVAIADLFMLPVIAREALAAWRDGRGLPRSTMTKPFALLLVVFVIATCVGYWQVGRLTSWALFNKDAGIVFETAVFFALILSIRRRDDVLRLARWFVVGMSVTNAIALVAVVAAFSGFDNRLYSTGNFRFFGWMENPSVSGGLLMAAAMIELGMLAAPAEAGRGRWLRWAGLWLMGVSLALTLSRSTWMAAACGAAVLLALFLFDCARANRWRLVPIAAAAVWFLAPTLVIGDIASSNLTAGVQLVPDERAADLREDLIGKCTTNPDLDVCADVQMPSAASNGAAVRVPRARVPRVPVASAADVSGPLMNARGLTDRLAIIRAALKRYKASLHSEILGIGLGTFYATSATEFGVPLIIHNTFVWFLVELGPLGLLAITWIWWQTTWNLWKASRSQLDGRYLGFGLLAAFAGLSVFCLFNEGFYQRQVWLIIALADRLRMLPTSTALSPQAGGTV